MTMTIFSVVRAYSSAAYSNAVTTEGTYSDDTATANANHSSVLSVMECARRGCPRGVTEGLPHDRGE